MLLVPGPHHPPPPAVPSIDVEMALRSLPLTAYKKPPPQQQPQQLQPLSGGAASTVEGGGSEGTSGAASGAARGGDGGEGGAKGHAGEAGRAASSSASGAGIGGGDGIDGEQQGGRVPAVQPGQRKGRRCERGRRLVPAGCRCGCWRCRGQRRTAAAARVLRAARVR